MEEALKLRNEIKVTTTTSEMCEEEACIPYSCISGILNDHPLVSATKVSKSEVHKCIAYMLNHHRRKDSFVTNGDDAEEETFCSRCNKSLGKSGCRQICAACVNRCRCGGALIEDMRQGCLCCDKCGLVQNVSIFKERMPLPISESELKMLESGADQGEVPKWLMARSAFGDNWVQMQLHADVEHWNSMMNLPEDELEAVKKMCSWMYRRASSESRIVASYIVNYLDKQYNVFALEEPFPAFEWKVPDVKGVCDKCSEKFYDLSSKRRHRCLISKDRKQWSLVANKSTRMGLM